MSAIVIYCRQRSEGMEVLMELMLPHAKRGDSVPRKFGVCLLNWLLWSVPAFADSTAPDIGESYQSGLVLIVALFMSVAINTALFGFTYFGLGGWAITGLEVANYLVFGAMYHLYR